MVNKLINMNKFNGIDQKKKDRSTTYVMRYTKDSIEDILRDYNTLQIDTTAEVINHFGGFFKPNNK